MPRKGRQKGAKAFRGLLEGSFEGYEVHLGVNYSCLQEISLQFTDEAEVHPLRHATKPPVHVP